MNPISRKTFSIEDIKSLFPEATPAEVLALLKEEREREEREREEREREREREERDRNEKRKTIEELLLWTDDLSARMAIHELATHMPLDLIISGLRTYPSTEWGLLPG